MTKLLGASLAAGLGLAACGLLGGAFGATGTLDKAADPGEAATFKAWLPRALAGDPAAAYRLGRAYWEGGIRRADFSEAAHWFRKAARAGHAPAQADLAMLYGKGLGVPRDYVKSYAWFAVAAETREYGLARDQALELRDMMAAFLTPAQRAEAERLAQDLRRGRTSDP